MNRTPNRLKMLKAVADGEVEYFRALLPSPGRYERKDRSTTAGERRALGDLAKARLITFVPAWDFSPRQAILTPMGEETLPMWTGDMP